MLKQLDAPRMIEVQDLHKSFGPVEVLKGVSLVAHKGEVISLIGASGSGKSTFLRCINFLELPSRGRIVIGNEELVMEPRTDGNLHAVDARQLMRLRTQLGMVFQNFNLWQHMTVLQNVMEAPVHVLKLSRAEAKDRAIHYLTKVGVSEKKDAYPATLSGGQQQRVAIARALAMEPKALLFDEPTSALDPILSDEVNRVISGLADEGRTMVIVTHDLAFAKKVSTHVMFLNEGLTLEQGVAKDMFNKPHSAALKRFLNGGSSVKK
jgi:ABC-type histidine transport system ATPase subunit